MAEAIVVPDLKEKLRALLEFGIQRLNRGQLEEALKVNPSTLRYYENGTAVRPPGKVPVALYKQLTELFSANLPGQRDHAEIVALLDAPGTAVRTAFISGSTVIWWSLVKRCAVPGGTLTKPEPFGFGFVDLYDPGVPEQGPEENTVELDEPFELSFSVPFSGFHMILQCAQRTWAGVPFAKGD